MTKKADENEGIVEEVVEETQIGQPSSGLDAESFSKSPQRQSRLFSFLLSKKVPPVPTEEERIPYPENPKRVLEYLFFWWIVPLYAKGYKRTIEDTDIYKFTDDMKIEGKYERYTANLNKRIADWKQKNPTKGNKWPLRVLLTSLLETFLTRVLMSFAFSLLFVGCLTGGPMINKALINYVEKRLYNRSATPIGQGIGYAVLNGLMQLFQLLGFAHTLDLAYKTGVDMKSLLVKHLFEKSMRLTLEGTKQFPTSKVTTLIGADLARLEFAFSLGNVGLAFLIGCIVSVVLIIYNIGVSALPGIGLLVVYIIFQFTSSKKLYSFRSNLNQHTDARVGLIRELINSYKTIKYFCWEEPYFEKIRYERTKEMAILLKIKLLRAAADSASSSLPTLSTMISFLVLYKLKGVSDVSAIFSSLSLFSILGSQMELLPMLFSSGADAISALHRVIEVLQCEEQGEEQKSISPSAPDIAIEVRNANFEWISMDGEMDASAVAGKQKQVEQAHEIQSHISNTTRSIVPIESILQEKFSGFTNVNISIKKGEFVMVTGLIGSGKTSLLNALSGIMTKTSGDLASSGSMLFCGVPWVQNATVRENILFGSPYDEDRYKKVLFSCALLDDLKLLRGGDLEEVGERGVTLSGGQKARINLARAVYADRDIILMDDVLSAVDAKVGEHIMKHCFLGMLQNKTRILATHQLSLITSVDSVIFLNSDGSLSSGTFDDLKNRNQEFLNLLSFNTGLRIASELEEKEKEEKEEEEEEEKEEEKENNKASDGLLMTEEKKAVNHLSLNVYKAFFMPVGAGLFGLILFLTLILTLALGAFTTQFINIWLSFWTDLRFESLSSNAYIGIYIMFNIVGIIFNFGQLASLSWVINNASKSLFIGAVKRLLRAPMSFMDTTPVGRVMNRFTKDTDVLDNEIYQSFLLFCTQSTIIIGSLVLTIVYLPWVALSIPALLIVCVSVTDFSQSTTRETKRVEAVRRSFVFDNINETLGGMVTIKAYGAEERFIKKNDNNMNRDNEAHYLNLTSQRWLTLQLTIPSAIYSFLVAILSATGVFHISPASTGLLLNSIINFSDALSLVFRTSMLIENSMNSAERLHQYSEQLEQEAPFKVSEYTPSPSWPVNPSIEFENVSLAYRPGLPLVLKNVSFQVKATEKVGICGRTGAGKSSIMTALYRIAELDSGKVIIDGLDVGKMGLKDLRSKLTIIPQETVLFKGTIRYNLDPFGQLADTTLRDALRKSGLVKEGESSKFELDLLVEDEGSNFSLGEKQLIALARALARESNILILDEATSSVDYETDSKIQSTIKNEFDGCTILCIAHRLKTILDYDKILVLDAGEVKEFDTPYNLYCKQDGIFRQMCESSNITEVDFQF